MQLIKRRASICNLVCSNRTPYGNIRLFSASKLWFSGPNLTHVLTAHAITPTCSHVCRQHGGIIKTACCVADFGSIHEPTCRKSEFRGARVRVCPEIGVGSQTLIRHIVAVTGPTCGPLPPLLHRQHTFRSAFSTS
jgi:hypothetical protein